MIIGTDEFEYQQTSSSIPSPEDVAGRRKSDCSKSLV